MADILNNFIVAMTAFQVHLPTIFMLTAIFWLIHLVNFIFAYRLNILGIYPRHLWGLIGIFVSPLLHANMPHLFFNTIPFMILSSCVIIEGWHKFVIISLSITILSGMAIWLFGRKAIHIGASALIMGYLGFLLMNIYSQGTIVAIAIGMICIYYLGGLLFSIFPSDVKTSWEGHLAGLLAGIATSYLLPRLLVYAYRWLKY